MTPNPLIFTTEFVDGAWRQREERRTLLERWVTFRGEHRELARVQLEAAAALVPPEQRARVMGPLHSSEDKEVMVAAGGLLLAKVLRDQGWQVEYEPEVDGLTPDFRIRKRGADFLVEARQVVGEIEFPQAYGRVRAALAGIKTRTPAGFLKMEVAGTASLRGFKAFLRRALADPQPGRQVFSEPGVLIVFDLHLPPLDDEIDAFFSYSPEAMWINDRSKVLDAIDEKLKKYRFPLIVALQSIGGFGLFDDAEDILYGSQAYSFPVSHKTGGPIGEGRHIRLPDSAAVRAGSDGNRVRDRLVALIPFEAPLTQRGWTVRARVLANPARPEVAELREFCPIPSLLHRDSETLGYFGAGGKPLEEHEQIADEFLP